MGNRPSGAAEAQWRARVEAWEASGLSLRQFALKEGLNHQVLCRWKVRLLGYTRVPAFASVVVAPSQPSRPGSFELVVGDGLSLRIPADFDEVALARLVSILGRR
jgi:hypothetical protein